MPSDSYSVGGTKVKVSSSTPNYWVARGSGIVVDVGDRGRKWWCLWLCKSGGTKAKRIAGQVSLSGPAGDARISNACSNCKSLNIRKWFYGFNVPKPYTAIRYDVTVEVSGQTGHFEGNFIV